MVVSLSRKRVTATESKAPVSRVGLSWCLYRFREKSYRYGIKGTGRSCRATADTPPPPPPTHPAAAGSVRVGRGGLRRAGGPCRGGLPRTMPGAVRHGAPANRAYAGRYGALAGPAAACPHAQCPAPPAVARPPTAPTQAVGVGRGRGLVAVYGLGKERKKLIGFWKPACLT